MRIEILIGNNEPEIYPLKNSKFIIGSGESCDVALSADGISRKHLLILTENDQYFVVDQGSTNGTYINEERLIPGKKTEFTSFFPVRLGDNVLVSLLSDEDDSDYESELKSFNAKEKTNSDIKISAKSSDATTVINLKDLQKAKTQDLVLERNAKREIRKNTSRKAPPPPPKKKPINFVHLLGAGLVLGAAYWNFFMQEPEKVEEIRQVAQIATPVKEESPKVEEPSLLVPEMDLVKKEDYPNILGNLICSIDTEIYLCNLIPHIKHESFGVSQVGLVYHIMLDGTRLLEDAKPYVTYPKDVHEASLKMYDESLKAVAAYIFLMRELPALDENLLKDSRISVAFFVKKENGYEVSSVAAFYPAAFNKFKLEATEHVLNQVKRFGDGALVFTKKYYTLY